MAKGINQTLAIKPLKKKLDKLFSLFIRKRDSNLFGIGECITCGRINHYKKMDAGHYIKRQHLATRYDEKNVNLQCKRCNAFEQGNNEVYRRKIDLKWGDGTADTLEMKKHNKVKWTGFEYKCLIEEYENKLKNIGGE